MLQPDVQTQDELRPLRAFVGLLNGWMGTDQSLAGQDGSAANPPRQFMTLGPQGISLEGTQTQVSAAPGAGLVIQPWMLAAAAACGAFLLMRAGRG